MTLPSEEDAPASPGTTLRRIAQDELLHASACLARKAGHRHKGVHLARKSIRRTRSLLVLASASLGPGADALGHVLSEANQRLSTLRDAQALVEAIDHFRSATRNGKWLAVLGRARGSAVQGRRLVLKHAMAEDPEFAWIREQLAGTASALHELTWDQVSIDDVQAAFSESKRNTRKSSRKARETEVDEDWHRWRRKARRQTQQHRLLAQAGIDSAVRHDDKDIAELLGKQQDCAMLLAFCEDGHSPIRWADRNQLRHYMDKKLSALRKQLARQSAHA